MGDRQSEIGEALFEKWQRWIEQIYNEVVTLFAHRSYYRGLAAMTQANEAIPASSFFDALGAWYGVTQSMGVRRQTDLSADAVSIAKLLANMAAHPQVMTRARFLTLWDAEEHWQWRANEQYDKYAGAAAAEIAPSATRATSIGSRRQQGRPRTTSIVWSRTTISVGSTGCPPTSS